MEWFSPQMTGGEEARIAAVLRSGYINDGPVTREFEARLAALVGVRHCVVVTSGTVAISLALMASGIGPGDEVLVPDFTFIATANAVRMTGAQVRLVDIEPDRLAIDPEALEKAIGPNTRAVVTVDVNGRGADYHKVEAICRDHGLSLITDSAEALGSKYAGRALGSFGRAGCFSFSPNKLVTTGQGGAITTDDESVYNRLLELKDQGRAKRGTGGDDLHPAVGFNFKFTDIQAAMGLAQLDALPARIERARERDIWYRELIGNLPGVTLPGASDEANEVRAWADILIERKTEIRKKFDENGIGYRAFWFPLHSQSAYGDSVDAFPVTNRISQIGLWLPSTFDITRDDVQRVSQVVRDLVLSSSDLT